MSKYTEYVSSQAASEQFKADLYAKIATQSSRKRRVSAPLKAVLSVSAAAVLTLAVVLPVTLNSNPQMALRRSYSKVFATIADAMFESGKVKAASPLKFGEVSHITLNKCMQNDSRFVSPAKFTEPKDNYVLYAAAAHIQFLSELYLNKNYVITDSPVSFVTKDIRSYYYVDGQPFECTLNYTNVQQALVDRENGIVTNQLVCTEEQIWQSGPPFSTTSYINFYAEYDFDANEVISFSIGIRHIDDKENIDYDYYLYSDNHLTALDVSVKDGDYQIFTAGMDNLQASFEAQGEQIIYINYDFREEFVRNQQYVDDILKQNDIS